MILHDYIFIYDQLFTFIIWRFFRLRNSDRKVEILNNNDNSFGDFAENKRIPTRIPIGVADELSFANCHSDLAGRDFFLLIFFGILPVGRRTKVSFSFSFLRYWSKSNASNNYVLQGHRTHFEIFQTNNFWLDDIQIKRQ